MIKVIDYGTNNIKSVGKAFEALEKPMEIVSDPANITGASALVLPGVGAYGDGMEGLRDRGFVQAINDEVSNGTPILGICLGMQLLFSESEEFGLHDGLDLLSGRVIPFRSPETVDRSDYKVPHMGWDEINFRSSNGDAGRLFENIPDDSSFYFVHSFYPDPDNPDVTLATTTHGGQEFACVVRHDNIWGTQFHPEKSSKTGLHLLDNFCAEYAIN